MSLSPGSRTNLIISIQSYIPNVRCAPPRAGHLPPNTTLCDEIAEGMVATPTMHVFGPRGAKNVQVALPYSLNLMSPSGSCELLIGTRGPPDEVSWFDLYTGIRAISAMCVKRREGGISTGQGR